MKYTKCLFRKSKKLFLPYFNPFYMDQLIQIYPIDIFVLFQASVFCCQKQDDQYLLLCSVLGYMVHLQLHFIHFEIFERLTLVEWVRSKLWPDLSIYIACQVTNVPSGTRQMYRTSTKHSTQNLTVSKLPQDPVIKTRKSQHSTMKMSLVFTFFYKTNKIPIHIPSNLILF